MSADGQGPLVGSVRSGSGFWAAGHKSSGTNSSAFTAFSSGVSHNHSLSQSQQSQAQSNRDSNVPPGSTSPDPYAYYAGSPSSPSGENGEMPHHRWPSPNSPDGMRGRFANDVTSPEPISPNPEDEEDEEDGSSDTTETDRRRGKKKSRKGGGTRVCFTDLKSLSTHSRYLH